MLIGYIELPVVLDPLVSQTRLADGYIEDLEPALLPIRFLYDHSIVVQTFYDSQFQAIEAVFRAVTADS
jgi:hypothetical protein